MPRGLYAGRSARSPCGSEGAYLFGGPCPFRGFQRRSGSRQRRCQQVVEFCVVDDFYFFPYWPRPSLRMNSTPRCWPCNPKRALQMRSGQFPAGASGDCVRNIGMSGCIEATAATGVGRRFIVCRAVKAKRRFYAFPDLDGVFRPQSSNFIYYDSILSCRYICWRCAFRLFPSCSRAEALRKGTDANLYGHVVDRETHEHIAYASVAVVGTAFGIRPTLRGTIS